MRSSILRRIGLVTATLALAVSIPLGAIAWDKFGDVLDSNPFHDDINYLSDAGVTSGCGGGNYCPSAFVTREQMAAFLNRLGALGPGKTPVVNATRLDGIDSSGFARGSRKTVDSFSGDGTLLLVDSRTGAEVRLGTSTGTIRITNTSATRRMYLAGLSSFGGAPEGESALLLPGESATFSFQSVHPKYLDLAITLSAMNAADVRFSHLTCSTADVGGGPPAMTSCLVTG